MRDTADAARADSQAGLRAPPSSTTKDSTVMTLHPLFKRSAAIALATFGTLAIAAPSTNCLDAASADDAALQTYTVTASDGVCLRAFVWKPGAASARGVVVITHGIRDYALRYSAFARQLNAQGYVVYAQDLRGHAHSGGQRQRFDSMEQLVADTDLVMEAAKGAYPSLPLFAFGHSLGGLVTTQYALAHGTKLKGLVLSGAALQRPKSVGDFASGAAKFVGTVAPGLKIVKVDDSEFSRDPAVMAQLASDPLVNRDSLPAATAASSIKGMAEVQARAAELRLPILVMYGLDDKVNPTEGSDLLLQNIGSSDKSLKTYAKVYHDMLHEPERDQIAADVIAWLNART
jgi:acylglycerol lipase